MKIQMKDIEDNTVQPVLNYCYKLEDDVDILYVYRGEMLAMTVDVKKAKKLRIGHNNQGTPIFALRREE
jgi:hypothetical protein